MVTLKIDGKSRPLAPLSMVGGGRMKAQICAQPTPPPSDEKLVRHRTSCSGPPCPVLTVDEGSAVFAQEACLLATKPHTQT